MKFALTVFASAALLLAGIVALAYVAPASVAVPVGVVAFAAWYGVGMGIASGAFARRRRPTLAERLEAVRLSCEQANAQAMPPRVRGRWLSAGD